uniref:RRM Nup35-type domain-containing protein n=1 Tax=Alexandrium andersonii TaxID=327968 RepID=A0A7S2CS91_9DINO
MAQAVWAWVLSAQKSPPCLVGMATWGSLGGAWQYAAGAPDGAFVHPKLFEAFGAEAKLGDDLGGFGANTQADVVGGFAEEVPRAFSARALAGTAGGGIGPQAGLGLGTPGIGLGAPVLPQPMLGAPGGDARWVTVFGFPGRAAALVRQQLEARCGPIVETCHGDGNFVHVRFHSTSAANACLAQNGRALFGKLLIGCVPCTSGLASVDQIADESEDAKTPSLLHPGLPPPVAAVGGAPWATLGAGLMDGPKVSRGSFFWNLLDLIFDI